jgi:hypothetical protein
VSGSATRCYDPMVRTMRKRTSPAIIFAQGNASVICCAIHSAVGCAVTLTQTSSPRASRKRAPTIKLGEEQAIAVRELDPTAHPPLQYNQLLPQRAFSASSRLSGLKSEAAKFKRTNISAAIAADVKRFCHQIKRTRFSAHTGDQRPLLLPRPHVRVCTTNSDSDVLVMQSAEERM